MRVDRLMLVADDAGAVALCLPEEQLNDCQNHHMELLSAVRLFTMLTGLEPVDRNWEIVSVKNSGHSVVWFNVAGPRVRR
jgi:hypothetical protein